jgi:hypothetical protein
MRAESFKKINLFMKKTVYVIAAFIGLVAVSCAVTNQNVVANPKYKNLKILPKDITNEQMDSVMHHYTASLNVKCNFCHVRNEEKKEWDWASDANKHKLIARQMMTMTNDINKKNFNHTGAAITLSSPLAVTCYTCHHGAKEPAVKAPQASTP